MSIKLNDHLIFLDRVLPSTQRLLIENRQFPMSYFVNLHNYVKSFGTHNYKGARVPLTHNNINVELCRKYLTRFEYPHIHILQFIEYGFPLGLWSEAFLVPSSKNHSSAYSFHSYVDKFIETELDKLGVTGPFDKSPWEDLMISPIMTAPKKPNSRRTVFDASFGMFSLNRNTPEKSYHDTEYEFTFPKIDDFADIISYLGPGCYLWKRDLSRFFLQLKIDPYEYNKLGFVWRSKLFLFVSFVWGCRHAGYAGQWFTTAIAYIHAALGLEHIGIKFNVLNYADDFAGAEKSLENAQSSFNTLGALLAELNIHESSSKACSPSTSMTYLGVLFNTVDMCLYVDPEKVKELKSELSKWVRKTTAKKSELQSILGKLLWVSKAVRFSRIFVSRIITEIRKLSKQSEKITLSSDIRKDFLWWKTYLEVFSGVEFIPNLECNIEIFGDACNDGGGAWNPSTKEYFSLKFPTYMCSPSTPIHIKEFIVLILSIRKWGSNWKGRRVRIYCDNDAVCDSCSFLKPKDPKLQQLCREYLYWVCKYNFFPIIEKIGTKDNFIADFLSRVHGQADIDKYFESLDYSYQVQVDIPLDWFGFQAEW